MGPGELPNTTSSNTTPSNILIVRLGSMGDILHMLPAVVTLKRNFPGAWITWAVESRWAALLRDNPCVDSVVPLDLARWRARWWSGQSWQAFLAKCGDLRSAGFDLALDFQGLIKSAVLAKIARPASLVGFHAGLLREGVVTLLYSRIVASDSRHMVDQNLDLAAAVGAKRRIIEFPLPSCAPEGDVPSGDFVLASPRAGWAAKQWPPEYYADLSRMLDRRLGMPLVINCAPGEEQHMATILDQTKGSCRLNVSSISGLIGITSLARAVVGLDSGPLHLADAMGKPGVALYGPTDPARNGPYGSTIIALRAPNSETTHARKRTIARSMQALRPESAFQTLETQIARHSILESHR